MNDRRDIEARIREEGAEPAEGFLDALFDDPERFPPEEVRGDGVDDPIADISEMRAGRARTRAWLRR